MAETGLPPVGAPALRALEQAGVRSLDDLRGMDVDALRTLHGIGPKALRLLRHALEERSDG